MLSFDQLTASCSGCAGSFLFNFSTIAARSLFRTSPVMTRNSHGCVFIADGALQADSRILVNTSFETGSDLNPLMLFLLFIASIMFILFLLEVGGLWPVITLFLILPRPSRERIRGE